MRDADDYLMLSGIQHFSYCKRQWALIHLEGVWAENTRTFGGGQMHERADDPFFVQSRGQVRISRAMPLVSHQLELTGISDVVEFYQSPSGITLPGEEGLWQIRPVEYKYGRPKEDHCDLVQLTAQAICLEEMFQTTIKEGAIYYGQTRHRVDVVFTEELRQETKALAAEMYEWLESGQLPPAHYQASCKNCSLYDLCAPKLKDDQAIRRYLVKAME